MRKIIVLMSNIILLLFSCVHGVILVSSGCCREERQLRLLGNSPTRQTDWMAFLKLSQSVSGKKLLQLLSFYLHTTVAIYQPFSSVVAPHCRAPCAEFTLLPPLQVGPVHEHSLGNDEPGGRAKGSNSKYQTLKLARQECFWSKLNQEQTV